MDKGLDIPLIEDQDKRKKFVVAIRCIYLGVLCIIFALEKNLAKFLDNELRLVSLVVLLYATHYFSCRAKGENFLFQAWGVKPPSKGALLVSDFLAAAMYISFFGVLVFQLLTSVIPDTN